MIKNMKKNALNKDKKYLKTYKKIESMWMITLSSNNYNNNKQNTYKKQKNVQEKKKQTMILIYHIQTMKGLPCLIFSVNITFTWTKRAIYL